MPPRVLAVLPAFIPSTLISVVKPLVRLHHRGLIRARIVLEHFTRSSDLSWAEVAVFCRNREPRFAGHREGLRARGVPIIYDLDDDLFEVPADTEEGRSPDEPGRIAELERHLRGARLARVYSTELLARVRALNPSVEQVEPSLDWSLVPDEPPRRDPSRVRIVYVTSRTEDPLAAVFRPDLERLLERYGSGVELTFWGGAPGAGAPRGARRLRPIPDYDRFLSLLGRRGFDVGLAPLVDDAFHRAKTNNKYREYGACRIAGVYSDLSVYSSCVRHGRTGLLVPARQGAWLEAVSRLVEDASLRARIQQEAWMDVRKRYSQDEAEEVWLEQIQRLRPRQGALSPASRARGDERVGGGVVALGARVGRTMDRLRRTGTRATLAGLWWYAHGIWTMLRLRRELS